MKKVLFICSAGMSTSLLVTKTMAVAKERGIDIDITAMAESEAKNNLDGCAIILLGPQVRFLIGNIKKLVAGTDIKVDVLDSVSYGRMDGNAVMDQIVSML